jgi:hypothetical protein
MPVLVRLAEERDVPAMAAIRAQEWETVASGESRIQRYLGDETRTARGFAAARDVCLRACRKAFGTRVRPPDEPARMRSGIAVVQSHGGGARTGDSRPTDASDFSVVCAAGCPASLRECPPRECRCARVLDGLGRSWRHWRRVETGKIAEAHFSFAFLRVIFADSRESAHVRE